MFVAADVSGDPISGNHKYMAIVACTTEFADNVITAGVNYKADLSTRKHIIRDRILSNLNFDDRGCIAFCIRIERNATFRRLKIKNEPKRFSPTQKKLFHAYHYRHFKTVRDRLEEFLSKHGYALTCLAVECDHDCKDFVSDIGLRSNMPGLAHKVADAIAWANNKGEEPQGVISIDEWDQIAADLHQRFKRAVLT